MVALRLGKRLAHRARINQFAIFLAAPGTPVPDQPIEWSDRPGFWQVLQTGGAAVVLVLGWSCNSIDIKIEATGPVTLDAPFTIAVRLTNTSGRSLPRDLPVELTAADAFGPGAASWRSSGSAIRGSRRRRAAVAAARRARGVVPSHAAPATRHLVILAKVLVHDPSKLGPVFLAGAIDGAAFDAAEPAVPPVERNRLTAACVAATGVLRSAPPVGDLARPRCRYPVRVVR